MRVTATVLCVEIDLTAFVTLSDGLLFFQPPEVPSWILSPIVPHIWPFMKTLLGKGNWLSISHLSCKKFILIVLGHLKTLPSLQSNCELIPNTQAFWHIYPDRILIRSRYICKPVVIWILHSPPKYFKPNWTLDLDF